MRIVIFFLFITLSVIPCFAQQKQEQIGVMSTVIDNFTGFGLGNSTLKVYDEKGTLVGEGIVIGYADRPKKGNDAYVNIPRKSGRYRFHIECEGYKPLDVWHNIKVKSRATRINLPPYKMQKDFKADSINNGINLDEVVVKATKVKFYYKGDTLIYNASAFNLPEGSMLDELIRQLPGATLNDDGEIKVNGKKIDMLTLNGKQFFGNNNKLMLDNLPYYTVDKIKVFDQTTERSLALGHDVEDKIHTMDVRLKREYSVGYLGNVGAGGGTQDRWLGRLFGLRFTDNSRVSLFFNSNNINETRKPGSDSNWQPSDLMAGMQKTYRGGVDINITDNYGRYEEKGFVSAAWTETENETRTAGENFLNEGNAYSRAMSAGEQQNLSVDLNNIFTFKKPWFVKFQTNGGYSRYNNEQSSMSATFSSDPDKFGEVSEVLDQVLSTSSSEELRKMTVNRTISEALSKGDNWNASQSVNTVKALPWGDDFEAGASVSYKNSTGRDWNKYSLYYMQNPALASDYRNRYNNLPSHSYDYSANALYRFNFFNGLMTEFAYKYDQSYNHSTENRYRLEQIAGWDGDLGQLPSTLDWMHEGLDADNSKMISSMSKNHNMKAKMRKSWNVTERNSWSVEIEMPLNLRADRMRYDSAPLDTLMKRNYTFFTPKIVLNFRGKASKTTKWSHANYLTYWNVKMPVNLLQTASIKNTYNPLSQNQGNTGLKNTTRHNLSLIFNNYYDNMDHNYNGIYLTMGNGLVLTFVENDVAMGYTYNPATGVYSYRPENVNGNWNLKYFHYLITPLDKQRKWNLNYRLDMTYAKQADLSSITTDNTPSESIRNRVNNLAVDYNLNLTYSFGKLRAGMTGQFHYRNTTSDRIGFNTLNAFDFNYGLNGQYTFPFGITLATDMKMYSRRGYGSSAMNSNDFVWNASISRTFLKNRLVATLQAFDILHQLSQTTYSVNSQGRTETWQRSLPNYLMLTMQWKFNKNPQKK